jgi:hypothetical protein
MKHAAAGTAKGAVQAKGHAASMQQQGFHILQHLGQTGPTIHYSA